MFIKATYNNEECLLNTDYIVDIFNADKWVADVYVLDIDRDAYKVKQSEIQRLIDDTADTPQTDEPPCMGKPCGICGERNYCKFAERTDTPQKESTGSPIGDYRDGVGAWQTDKLTEEEFDTMIAKGLLGQTDCDDRYAVRTDSGEVVAYACPLGCEQTDCGWK